MIVAVDFDGTIVTHAFPYIGSPVPGALAGLRAMMAADVKLILWTMRSGDTLTDALTYLHSERIDLWGINENPDQAVDRWSTSPKQYANYYIDDSALGTPLIVPDTGERPYVDWYELRLPRVGFLPAK